MQYKKISYFDLFSDSQVHPDTLLHWLKKQVVQYEELVVENLTSSFRDGLILCAIIHRYRPDLLDFHSLKKEEIAQNNQLAFDILEREYGKILIDENYELLLIAYYLLQV